LTRKPLVAFDVSPHTSYNNDWLYVLEELEFIQNKSGVNFILPTETTQVNVNRIALIAQKMRHGYCSGTMNTSEVIEISLTASNVLQVISHIENGQLFLFEQVYEMETEDVFDTEINLGEVKIIYSGMTIVPNEIARLKAVLHQSSDDSVLSFQCTVTQPVRFFYRQWLPTTVAFEVSSLIAYAENLEMNSH
jgi:hypothetical protein